MALFFASTKPWVTAVQEIADTVGASGQSAMTDRAHKSLIAAFQYFNGRKWEFLTTEAAPIRVVGAFGVALTASSGQVTAVVPTNHGLIADDLLVGNGFLQGTRVTATGAATVAFNAAVSLSAGANTFTVTAQRGLYTLPTDFKMEYDVRIGNRSIQPIRRRLFNRSSDTFYASGTVDRYDIYGVGQYGKIKLYLDPANNDTLNLGYYRRMAVGSASSDSTTLDIPVDYEPYVVAWGKWHFLMDKSEGRSEQGQTWLALAQEGLKTMEADQTNRPDEGLGFIPGHYFGDIANPNSTRQWLNEP